LKSCLRQHRRKKQTWRSIVNPPAERKPKVRSTLRHRKFEQFLSGETNTSLLIRHGKKGGKAPTGKIEKRGKQEGPPLEKKGCFL